MSYSVYKFVLQKSKQVRLIPSLDGGLYQVNGDSIEVHLHFVYSCQ